MLSIKSLTHRAARHVVWERQKVRFDKGVVSFSFDDFPKSAAVAGHEVLDVHGVRATYFACRDYMGQTVEGIRQYDRDDLIRIRNAGHEIGCHTARHRRLSKISGHDVAAEFQDNAAFFEEQDLPLATVFAYPYGDVNLRAKQRSGSRFAACRGVWKGLNSGVVDRALLKCVCLEAHNLDEKPAEDWIAEAVERKAWLIFLTHDVASNHSYYGISPGKLSAIAECAANSGADILPIGEAYDLGVSNSIR